MTPPIRKDDFCTSIMMKLNALSVFGMEKGIDAILCGGDLLNHPRVSSSVLSGLASMINMCQIPWYVVLGQHDIEGHNWTTYKTSGVGVLAAAMPKLFNILPNAWNGGIAVLDHSVRVAGFHYQHNGEEQIAGALAGLKEKANIAIVHALVTPKAGHIFPHIPADALPTNIPLILTGDYHPGVLYRLDDMRGVYNPGSLARVSKKADSGRIPTAILLNTETEELNYIGLPYKEDVWTDQVDTVAIDPEEFAYFIDQLGGLTTKDLDTIDIQTMVRTVAKKTGISDVVVAYAIQALSEGGGS
jgi:DNA repair exonuclease SbcCD nuclease subunit